MNNPFHPFCQSFVPADTQIPLEIQKVIGDQLGFVYLVDSNKVYRVTTSVRVLTWNLSAIRGLAFKLRSASIISGGETGTNSTVERNLPSQQKAMLSALVFTVLLTFVSGAPNGGTGRLMGGSQAASGQFPFVVSISRFDQHICGGFIYNDRWIVTTAKCISGKPKEELKVTIGALSLITPDPEEQIITILDMIVFDLYEEATQKHDIALIELSRPIVFGPTAQPIRYDEIDELATPWDAKIVGWGATFEGGVPATRLRWAPIDDLAADCRAYGIDQYIQNLMICAGSTTGTISPCQYDEGTPLTQMANYGGVPEEIVVGIMSKNQGCADLTIPSIYTRLATYYSWLLQTAGQQPAPTRTYVNSK